ncbi:MAG: TonB-dependent receptor plug domain-containing protein, partial [Bacteroidales bacterium]|nr:TonB-dependent receptor plug domain-containing protein [Bacteroidales bacterium]
MAQGRGETIKGKLTSINDKKAIPYAVIKIVETEQWTTTDKNGLFVFNKVTADKITLEVQCLGKQKYCKSFICKDYLDKAIDIRLLSESYAMKEVVVTAEKGQGMSTTSTIENAAIQHVQPTTLGDVMQLLPGGLIENPDLSGRQTISIREIGTDANSAAGTAIIVDGAPISNDGNFQTISTTKITTDGSSLNNSNLVDNNSIGSGLDLRQINTDNIESIEVIKGIPSVQYGNLTSGAVIVKTKSGYTPYEVKIKSDPRLKQFYIGKGVKLDNGSTMNANVEYTNSYKDLRSKFEGFNRISGQLAYSNTFMRESSPLSFNTKISFHHILDEEKTDPDAMTPEEVMSNTEAGTRLNIYGKWALNNRFITNLNYNLSTSVTK